MERAIQTIIGLENHVADSEHAGDAWVSDASGAAVTSATGFPVDDLNSPDLNTAWRSAGLTEAETRLIRRFSSPRRLGAGHLANTNLSEDAVIEFFAGEKIIENVVDLGPSALESFESSPAINTTTDFTFLWRGIIRPALANPYGVNDVIAFFGSGYGATVSEFYVRFQAAGLQVEATAVRYGGAAGNVWLQGDVDHDGETEYEIILRCRDSDTRAELLINGVVAESTTANHVAIANVNHLLKIGHGSPRIRVSEAQLWGRYLEDADLEMARNATGNEHSLRVLWRMNGTGTTIDDESAGTAYNATIAGGAPRTSAWIPATSKGVGAKPAYGENQYAAALLFSGASAASVTRTVAATTKPRTFTVEFKIQIDSTAVDLSTSKEIFRAVSGSDCSLTLETTGLRASVRSTTYTFAASVTDGSTRRIRIRVDGINDLYTIDVDGAEVDSGSCSAYVTAASFDVAASCAVGIGFKIWDVRLYGALRRDETLAWRAVAPWEDLETMVLLPLAGHVTELVSGADAVIAGSIEYAEVERSGVSARPGGLLGESEVADPIAKIPRQVSEWWDSEPAEEAGIAIFDPKNSDGYINIMTAGFFATHVPSISRSEGRTLGTIAHPATNYSPSSVPLFEIGATLQGQSFTIGNSLRREAHQLFQRLDRVKGLKSPVLVIITSWAELHELPWEVVYGLVHRLDDAVEGSAEYYAKTITIAPLELSAWR